MLKLNVLDVLNGLNGRERRGLDYVFRIYVCHLDIGYILIIEGRPAGY